MFVLQGEHVITVACSYPLSYCMKKTYLVGHVNILHIVMEDVSIGVIDMDEAIHVMQSWGSFLLPIKPCPDSSISFRFVSF